MHQKKVVTNSTFVRPNHLAGREHCPKGIEIAILIMAFVLETGYILGSGQMFVR